MIKVAIVEDNDQFRTALETIVNQETDTTLVGSYTSAEKALSALEQAPPDIAIIDISLPGIRGTELIVRLKDKLRHLISFAFCNGCLPKIIPIIRERYHYRFAICWLSNFAFINLHLIILRIYFCIARHHIS